MLFLTLLVAMYFTGRNASNQSATGDKDRQELVLHNATIIVTTTNGSSISKQYSFYGYDKKNRYVTNVTSDNKQPQIVKNNDKKKGLIIKVYQSTNDIFTTQK